MRADESTRAGATSGRGVRVAVIDSGVHAAHPHVGGVAGGIAFDGEGRCSDDYLDRIGHGTAVTAVIKEKAPEAECHAVRIFADRLSARAATVIAAMEWAIAEGMHIINLSLGTTNQAHEPAFRATVARAAAAGVLIVSAQDDDEHLWLPGGLAGVVGVKAGWDCPRHQLRISAGTAGPVFQTSGFARPIGGIDPWRNLHGSSFAVANVTGVLCGLLTGRQRTTFEHAAWLLSSVATPSGETASVGSPQGRTRWRRDI